MKLYYADRSISSKLFELSSKIEIKLKSYLIEIVYELTDNPFFYLLKDSYIEDFKIYTQNHLNTKYFITALGCGIAGYQISDIAPLFQGISCNVIFPESFRPYVEKNAARLFPNLTSKLLHSIFSPEVILAEDYTEAIKQTLLNKEQRQIALKVLEQKMYPEDQYGRSREYEIEDILKQINDKVFQLSVHSDESYIYGGVILALMELYDFNEQDFIRVWNAEIEIKHPIKRHH